MSTDSRATPGDAMGRRCRPSARATAAERGTGPMTASPHSGQARRDQIGFGGASGRARRSFPKERAGQDPLLVFAVVQSYLSCPGRAEIGVGSRLGQNPTAQRPCAVTPMPVRRMPFRAGRHPYPLAV
jgi:hypothetical protein